MSQPPHDSRDPLGSATCWVWWLTPAEAALLGLAGVELLAAAAALVAALSGWH